MVRDGATRRHGPHRHRRAFQRAGQLHDPYRRRRAHARWAGRDHRTQRAGAFERDRAQRPHRTGGRPRGRQRHRRGDDRRRGRGPAGEVLPACAVSGAGSAGESRTRSKTRGRAMDRPRGRALHRARGLVPREPEIATLRLTGHDLTIADVVAVARRDVAVGLDRAAERQVEQAAKVVAQIARADDPVYGINTGFGDLSTVRVPHDELRTLQRNLLRSHAVGIGPPLPEDVVRAILLLRANTLAAGRSGVRAEVIDLLCDMLNRRVHPVIPKHGSVGASGDLAPLAHAALVLIGEGETLERASGAAALKAAGLKPIELAPKEGVSLINGTQVMTAIGCLALHDAEVLATTADVIGAMSAEALRATDRAWDADLHATRPHPGQRAVAANLRSLMAGSPNVASHRVGDPRVQDPYSIRCMPQVHGASRDALAYTRRVLEIEINSVTDNPIVFAEDHRVVSGGNF